MVLLDCRSVFLPGSENKNIFIGWERGREYWRNLASVKKKKKKKKKGKKKYKNSWILEVSNEKLNIRDIFLKRNLSMKMISFRVWKKVKKNVFEKRETVKKKRKSIE